MTLNQDSRHRSPQLVQTKNRVMASASFRLVDWKNTASPWLHFGQSTVLVRGSVGSVTTSDWTSVRSAVVWCTSFRRTQSSSAASE